MERNEDKIVRFNGCMNAYRRSLTGAREIENSELAELLIKYKDEKNYQAKVVVRQEIIERSRLLIDTIVMRMGWWLANDAVLDLIQDATIAVYNVVQNYDADKGRQPMTHLMEAIKNATKDNLSLYTHCVRRPVGSDDEDVADCSLDEYVNDESGMTRADMVVGEDYADRKTSNDYGQRYARRILETVLNAQEYDVMTRLFGMKEELCTESSLALQYGVSVDRIQRIKRTAVDKLVESEYYNKLKQLLCD